MEKIALVVAWHNEKQIAEFKEAWRIESGHDIYFQQDTAKEGCAITKNKGIFKAWSDGAETIIVLDDDCYPATPEYTIEDLRRDHNAALEPQEVRMIVPTTHPPSRGTPYRDRNIKMPVAASMGFWHKYPDLDAATALVLGDQIEVGFLKVAVFWRYFPFCGMNFAFKREWFECAQLINVPRMDDIWMGWIWQKIAFEKGYCFNLNGPMVNHMRQSNVWKNLQQEVKYLEQNETLWKAIHAAPRDASPSDLRGTFFGDFRIPDAPLP